MDACVNNVVKSSILRKTEADLYLISDDTDIGFLYCFQLFKDQVNDITKTLTDTSNDILNSN